MTTPQHQDQKSSQRLHTSSGSGSHGDSDDDVLSAYDESPSQSASSNNGDNKAGAGQGLGQSEGQDHPLGSSGYISSPSQSGTFFEMSLSASQVNYDGNNKFKKIEQGNGYGYGSSAVGTSIRGGGNAAVITGQAGGVSQQSFQSPSHGSKPIGDNSTGRPSRTVSPRIKLSYKGTPT